MFKDLKFFYDEEKRRLQSSDPAIYVCGSGSRHPKYYFNLYWENRVIRFMAKKEVSVNEKLGITETKWELSNVNVTPVDPTQKAYVYKSQSEGLQAVDIMMAFLRQTDGHRNMLLRTGKTIVISARLSDWLKQAIIKGVD